ncbi:MAG: hypothetical protein ABIH70_00930 [Chloroflexota bacterium]
MKVGSVLARLDVTHRHLPLVVWWILAPILGAACIIVLPSIGIVLLVTLAGYGIKRAMTSIWRKLSITPQPHHR